MPMNIDELVGARNQVETEYNNLINPAWVAERCHYLRGKYDTYTDQINKEQANATSQTEPKPAANRNNNKRKQIVQG